MQDWYLIGSKQESSSRPEHREVERSASIDLSATLHSGRDDDSWVMAIQELLIKIKFRS